MKKIFLTYKYLLITIVLVMVCVTLGLCIWRYNIAELQENHKREVSEIIRVTIQKEAQRDILLPEIVFINVDTSQKAKLNDKILAQISEALIAKYSSDNPDESKNIDIQPFYAWPNKKDKNGNYTLTED